MGVPRLLEGGKKDHMDDPRVLAVLAVLGGRNTREVAAEYGVSTALLHRWVSAFVSAGTAQITNRPDASAAAQRDRFLASFAHEVRTPLTVALGWAAVLDEEDVPGPMLRETFAHLHDALLRLNERTHDVELLSSASLGRLRVDKAIVRVGDLVSALPDAGEVQGDGPDLEIFVDVRLTVRILRDLLQAARQRPEPRAVHVETRVDGSWVDIAVVRDAEPVEPRVLQALFDPFDVNDDATGITMGLYLARALAVAHGGTLGVDQDDEGARFWLRIPYRAADIH